MMIQEQVLHITDDLALPPNAVTQTLAILARRGAGKTYTACVFAEELLKQERRVVILDPLGVWWGLRLAADGQSAGYPIVILGGAHGDLPLRVDAAARIAELVAKNHLPVILDLSDMDEDDQCMFVGVFTDTLYKFNRTPLHLIIDEADIFAPQRSFSKAQEVSLRAIKRVIQRGRARAIGATLISQRSAVLHKDPLSQIEVLIAMQTTSPQDIDAIGHWIKRHGEKERNETLLAALPALAVGVAYVWSPSWLKVFQRVQIRRRETFDSSATPEVGAVVAPTRIGGNFDLTWLSEALSIEVSADASEEVQHLRREIVQLQVALEQKPKNILKRVEIPVLTDGQVDQLTLLAQQVLERSAELLTFGESLLSVIGQAAVSSTATVPAELPAEQVVQPPVPTKSVNGDNPTLHSSAVRILRALAQRYPARWTRAQIATLTNFTDGGGAFNSHYASLKRASYIEEVGDKVVITTAGFDFLGVTPARRPQTSAEVQQVWKNALSASTWRVLEALINVYPSHLTKDDLAAATGFTAGGGAFNGHIGTLRGNDLIKVEAGRIQASRELIGGGS